MWPQCLRHLTSKILRIRPSGQAALASKRERRKKENEKTDENIAAHVSWLCLHTKVSSAPQKTSKLVLVARLPRRRQHLIITRAFSCSHKKMQLGARPQCLLRFSAWLEGRQPPQTCACKRVNNGWAKKKTCLSILMKFSIQGYSSVFLNLLLLLLKWSEMNSISAKFSARSFAFYISQRLKLNN